MWDSNCILFPLLFSLSLFFHSAYPHYYLILQCLSSFLSHSSSSSTPSADQYAPAGIVPLSAVKPFKAPTYNRPKIWKSDRMECPDIGWSRRPSNSTWRIWLHQNDSSEQRESGWRMIGQELHGITFSACSRSGCRGQRQTSLHNYQIVYV